MGICPDCGKEIDSAGQFCKFCGAEIPPIPTDFDLKGELQTMDEYEFEHLVADLWEEMGWECSVSQGSNDQGIDVTALKENPFEQKTLIQAKRYGEGNTVGSPKIQQYSSLKQQEDNVDSVIMVTTSRYSSNAKDLASKLNVKLISGDDLVELIKEHDADHIVEEYFGDELEEEPEPADREKSGFEFGDKSQQPTQESNWEERSEHLEYDDAQVSAEVQVSSENNKRTAPLIENQYEENEGGSDDTGIDLPPTTGKTIVLLSTLSWAGLFALSAIASGAGLDLLMGSFLLFGWIFMPVGIFYDARGTQTVAEWPKYRKTYILLSMVWFLNILIGAWYLLMRAAVEEGHSDVDRVEATESDAEPEQSPATIESDFEITVESLFSDEDELVRATVNGEYYPLKSRRSENEQWTVIYGRNNKSQSGKDGLIALFEGDDLIYGRWTERVDDADVSNTGTVVAQTTIEGEQEEEVSYSGNITVYNKSGNWTLGREFDSNLSGCAISNDGRYILTATYNPDRSIYVFDGEEKRIRAREDSELNGPVPEFGTHAGQDVFYLYNGTRSSEPDQAITPDGDLIWRRWESSAS